MSKTIDFFAISPELHVTGLHTHADHFGSDHAPVIAHVAGSTGGHRWGYVVCTWNVEDETRQTEKNVLHGLDTLISEGVDVLMLQEVGRYKAALRKKYGDRLQLSDAIPGADDCAILVADGVSMKFNYTARLTLLGWITVRGGRHPGQALATAAIDGRFRASAGHMPVSVRWPLGIPAGPPMRVAAWLYAGSKIPRFVKRHNRLPHVLGQDWNARAGQKGVRSPERIAHAAGLVVHATTTATHA
jgi:hypothetical protein